MSELAKYPQDRDFEWESDSLGYATHSRMLTAREMNGLARIYFPADQIRTATDVAWRLSRWNTGIWLRGDADRRGLWLLDVIEDPELQKYDLFDPMVNCAFAADKLAAGGWEAWPDANVAPELAV